MPEITIKYEHPHELTELLSKLAQMYIVPQTICNVDTPYPPNYVQNKSLDDLKVQLKDSEQRALAVLENYHVVCKDLNIRRKELVQCQEELLKTQAELDAANIYIDCLTMSKKDEPKTIGNAKDNSPFITDSDNQLFTLEEAAEYLEVGINEMPLVMANHLKMDIHDFLSIPNMDKLTTKGFFLSELREIKAKIRRA